MECLKSHPWGSDIWLATWGWGGFDQEHLQQRQASAKALRKKEGSWVWRGEDGLDRKADTSLCFYGRNDKKFLECVKQSVRFIWFIFLIGHFPAIRLWIRSTQIGQEGTLGKSDLGPCRDGESGQMGCEEGISWPPMDWMHPVKGMGRRWGISGAGCGPGCSGGHFLKWCGSVSPSFSPLFFSYLISHFLAEFSLRR